MTSKVLRLPEVRARIGLSRSQVYLMIKRGEFPPPIKIGARASAWMESDVDAWLAERLRISREA